MSPPVSLYNFYVTGASGFLGGQLVKDAHESHPDAKIYIPLRDKKGESAASRFKGLYIGYGDSVVLCDPKDPIPGDTTHIILNAYSISFKGDIAKVLRDNVEPMLGLLDQCSQLAGLRSVTVVSTAFVQPPLPYKICKAPIPFCGSDDPGKLYKQLLADQISWQDLKDDQRNDPHTTTNAYICSKTVMEHLVLQRYGDSLEERSVALIIARPSIISSSEDGHGSAGTPPCVMTKVVDSIACRTVPGKGRMDFVHVDHVSQLLIKWATDSEPAPTLAVQQQQQQQQLKCNGVVAKVVFLTSGSKDLSPKAFGDGMSRGSKWVWFYHMRFWWLAAMVRAMELFVIRFTKGKRAAQLLRGVYSETEASYSSQLNRHFKACTTDIYIHNECAHAVVLNLGASVVQ